MRRWLLPVALLLCASATLPALAQTETKPETAAESKGDPWLVWKAANFVILVGLLGYMIKKRGGAFFENRTRQIQASMREAEQANREAQERIVLMERRLAGLGDEIEKLRSNMRHEMAAEGERIRLETERHIHRIQAQAEQEIESMTKRARRELKMYAAGLALESAEQQLTSRISNDIDGRLVSSFSDSLRSRSSEN